MNHGIIASSQIYASGGSTGDLRNAVYDNQSLTDSEPWSPEKSGVYISASGDKLYVGFNEKIFQYDLSTPFDITTSSNRKTMDSYAWYSRQFHFNSDGTLLHQSQDGNGNGIIFSVSTPWDLTTTTETSSRVYGDSNKQGHMMMAEGNHAFYTFNSSSSVGKGWAEDDPNSFWDYSQWWNQNNDYWTGAGAGANLGNIFFNSDGSYMYISVPSLALIRQYITTTPYDPLGASFDYEFSFTNDAQLSGFCLSADNQYLYCAGWDNSRPDQDLKIIYRYSL